MVNSYWHTSFARKEGVVYLLLLVEIMLLSSLVPLGIN